MSAELLEQITSFQTSQDEKLTAFEQRFDRIEAEIRRPDGGSGTEQKSGFGDYTTPGSRLVKMPEVFEQYAKTRRVRIELKNFWPAFEEKTLIDSAALGFATPGILGAQNISPIVAAPRRRLTVRDLMRSRSTKQAQASWIRENSFTNAASPQVEGSAKAESAVTFTIDSEKVRTIAHWLPVSRQALDDMEGLREFIDSVLLYGLKIKEETEILNGDNLGDHLNGLVPQATAYAGTFSAGGDTKLDSLRHVMLELEEADEITSGFVLNPREAHAIDLIKTEEGAVNRGSYVGADPLGGALRVRTYWGVPVVVTKSMPAGKFLAGDFSKAIIIDRQDATIDLSEEHDNFFVLNKIAIRAEERCLLAVLRPGAFRYGTL